MSLGKQKKKNTHNSNYILEQLLVENCNDQDWTITTGDMSLLIGNINIIYIYDLTLSILS